MENKFVAQMEISINANPSKVWDALTNPVLIKQYFFGTEAVSDWKKGSSLLFKGNWEGKEYLDKGTILEIEPCKLLRYNYLSSFSGLEDRIENYANITYLLIEENNFTKLLVTQDNIETQEAKLHSEGNWQAVLNGLKKLVEENI
jgi:uncharacterized protein YndB with AHSA1/START domain